MKKAWFFAGALVVCCLRASGQTNSAPALGLSFFFPSPQLRGAVPSPEAPALPATEPGGNTQGRILTLRPEELVLAENSVSRSDSSATKFVLESGANDIGQLYGSLGPSSRFLLTRPEPRSENVFVRCAEDIFEPEVVHLGKTTFTCSLLTAIKRKNPLCLINSIFLQLSW